MAKTNTVSIKLILTTAGLRRFKTTPTFRDMLHDNQNESLTVGENFLTVNNTVWGSLTRLAANDNHIKVEKIQ